MLAFPNMDKLPALMLTPGTSPWNDDPTRRPDPANVWIPGSAQDLPVLVMVTSSVTLDAYLTAIWGGTLDRPRWNETPGNSVASVISSRPPRMLISLPSTKAPPVIWISPSLAKASTLMPPANTWPHRARRRSLCLQHHRGRIQSPQAAAQTVRPRSPFRPPMKAFYPPAPEAVSRTPPSPL